MFLRLSEFGQLIEDGGGLSVKYPGIKLASISPGFGKNIMIVGRDAFRMSSKFHEGVGLPKWDQAACYAVIFASDLNKDGRTTSRTTSSNAMLGSLGKVDRYIEIQYICTGTLEQSRRGEQLEMLGYNMKFFQINSAHHLCLASPTTSDESCLFRPSIP